MKYLVVSKKSLKIPKG